MYTPLIEEIRAQLGAETDAFLAEMERPPSASLRLNSLRGSIQKACERYIEDVVPWCPDGRYIRPGTRPGLSPLHAAGAYYIQEASAMAPAMVLDARPGERVLDLCAAPGGKAGQLAAALGGEGLLVANEVEPARAKVLLSTLERLGVTNAVVLNAPPDKLSPLFGGFFDAILVDAPCSGEGMFRRDPAKRAQWTSASPAGCAARQAVILEHASRMLRPGGRLVYSTCTFNRTENERVIEAFLRTHAEFSPGDFALPGVGASRQGCLRLWPQRLRGEGHFVALLRKSDVDSAPTRALSAASKPDREALYALKLLQESVPGLKKLLSRGTIMRDGSLLRLVPSEMISVPGVRVLRGGLQLCRMGRGYIEPDHALAMALRPSDVENCRALTDAEAEVYLRGETLPCDGRGWTLVTYGDLPLGWGKAVNGTLKNHLPKGLRKLGNA